jgi:hypothetical protein
MPVTVTPSKTLVLVLSFGWAIAIIGNKLAIQYTYLFMGAKVFKTDFPRLYNREMQLRKRKKSLPDLISALFQSFLFLSQQKVLHSAPVVSLTCTVSFHGIMFLAADYQSMLLSNEIRRDSAKRQ